MKIVGTFLVICLSLAFIAPSAARFMEDEDSCFDNCKDKCYEDQKACDDAAVNAESECVTQADADLAECIDLANVAYNFCVDEEVENEEERRRRLEEEVDDEFADDDEQEEEEEEEEGCDAALTSSTFSCQETNALETTECLVTRREAQEQCIEEADQEAQGQCESDCHTTCSRRQ